MYTFTAAYRDNIACERISNKAQSIMGIVEDVKEIYIQLFFIFFFIWLDFSVYIFLLRFKIKPFYPIILASNYSMPAVFSNCFFI